MKKALLSLLTVVVFLPMAMGQTKDNRVFVSENVSVCGEYTWVDGQVYTHDTLAMYTSNDTVYVLNLTMLTSIVDTVEAVEVSGNCSYVRDDKEWKVAGTYYDTLVSPQGCDSIIKIHVTLAGVDSTNATVTACDSYKAPWGEVLQESGDFDTVLTVEGCQRHDILHLTVRSSYRAETEVATGDCSILWNDMTLTDTGYYEKVLTTAEGCDSVLSLRITAMTHVGFDTLTVEACDSYVTSWGDTLTTSGSSTHVGMVDNCELTTTLNLTVYRSYSDTVVREIEAGCSYRWEGTTYSDTLVHFAHLATVNGGCDSLAAIRLTLSGIDYDTTNAVLCGNTTYSWHGTSYNAAAQADVTEETSACTTHYHLNLTVGDAYDTVVRSSCAQYIYTYDARSGAPGQTESATFTESGVYSYDNNGTELLSKHWSTGCITHHTLDLTIVEPQQRERKFIVDTAACDKYTFTVGRTSVRDIDHDTVLTLVHYAHGTNGNTNICYDSIGTLHLTIKHSTVVDTVVTVCDTFYWDLTDKYYTASGVDEYKDSVLNEDGCSIIGTLNLTVNYTPEVTIEGDLYLTPNESTTLTATCNMANVRYAWYKGTSSTAASTTNILALENVTANQDVHLVTTSREGCVANNWVTVTCNEVGIEGVEGMDVSVYPNPTARVLNVESAEAIQEVAIYNVNAQQVMVRQGEGSRMHLDLGSLPAGHYALRIVSQSGEQATRTIVVAK